MIAKGAASDADLVFLDLEDAVAPAQKEAAREMTIEALNGLDWGRKTRAVRINAVNTVWVLDDIIQTVERAGQNLDVIIIPKVKAPRDVWFVETLLDQLEAKLGLAEPHRPRGPHRGDRSPRARRGDRRLLAAARGAHPRRRRPLRQPGHPHGARQRPRPALSRRHLALRPQSHDRRRARRTASTPSTARFPTTATATATGARPLGQHARLRRQVGDPPDQIPIANEVFAPTEKEIALARRMVEAYEAAQSGGAGAGSAAGVLVDAATVRIFQAVLERAKLVGSA